MIDKKTIKAKFTFMTKEIIYNSLEVLIIDNDIEFTANDGIYNIYTLERNVKEDSRAKAMEYKKELEKLFKTKVTLIEN